MTQVVEHLLGVQEALRSILGTGRKKWLRRAMRSVGRVCRLRGVSRWEGTQGGGRGRGGEGHDTKEYLPNS
jgi:hypothetical protein